MRATLSLRTSQRREAVIVMIAEEEAEARAGAEVDAAAAETPKM